MWQRRTPDFLWPVVGKKRKKISFLFLPFFGYFFVSWSFPRALSVLELNLKKIIKFFFPYGSVYRQVLWVFFCYNAISSFYWQIYRHSVVASRWKGVPAPLLICYGGANNATVAVLRFRFYVASFFRWCHHRPNAIVWASSFVFSSKFHSTNSIAKAIILRSLLSI